MPLGIVAEYRPRNAEPGVLYRVIDALPPPTDEEVGMLLAAIAARVERVLRHRGFASSEGDVSGLDPVAEESPALAGLSSASIQGRIALGHRAGRRVWRVGSDPEVASVVSGGSRHAHIAGFDLHANVAVPAADRARLEQLCGIFSAPRWPRTGCACWTTAAWCSP